MALANNDAEPEQVDPSSVQEPESHSTQVLMLGALGVVYGDIGTSPIYAFREALHASDGVVGRGEVLGVLSLIVWALTIIVTIKYVIFVLRADNKGEGGTLSLMALARSSYPAGSKLILVIGLCGASLFFGDSVITPAISVLSAVEGLEVVTPAFDSYVVPITLVILAMLFAVQRFGTGKVAAVFGPVMAMSLSSASIVPSTLPPFVIAAAGKPAERYTSPVMSTSARSNFTAVSPSVWAGFSGTSCTVSPLK